MGHDELAQARNLFPRCDERIGQPLILCRQALDLGLQVLQPLFLALAALEGSLKASKQYVFHKTSRRRVVHTLPVAFEEIATLFLFRLWFLLSSLPTSRRCGLASVRHDASGGWEASVGLIVIVVIVHVIVQVVGARAGATTT